MTLDEITDPVDRLVSHAVYSRGCALQASGRLSMTGEQAQALFDSIRDDLAAVETAIGRELPHARGHLGRIAADRWAGVR